MPESCQFFPESVESLSVLSVSSPLSLCLPKQLLRKYQQVEFCHYKMSHQHLIKTTYTSIFRYLTRPVTLLQRYEKGNLQPDLIAGITVAVIALPQAIAFSLVAELPPQMGLYSVIISAIVGALWGSSNQSHTGPANIISLLIFGSLATVATAGTPELMLAAGLLAILVGLLQLLLGLAQLGVLVNFISHSVIVGFATGAGVLIGVRQLRPLLQLSVSGGNVVELFLEIVRHLTDAHLPSLGLGALAIIVMILLRRINPKLPAVLIAMAITSFLVYFFRLTEQGVSTIGQLPRGFPPVTRLPLFDFVLVRKLMAGAVAIAAIGLVETVAITRSISSQTGQRLDNNQEFVGQGLANIFAGIFSGYPVASSFSRSALNFEVGARTPISAIFSSVFVLIAMFVFAPLSVYVPSSALAGILIITAIRMIHIDELNRIFTTSPSDALIMIATLLGTLFLDLEYAVLLGMLLSFIFYVQKTSTPRLLFLAPDQDFRHLIDKQEREDEYCPQLGILEIRGDLYFGAVTFIEEMIHHHLEHHPDERFLLVRMSSVNQIDFSGIHALETIVKMYRERGGDVFLIRVSPDVKQLMESSNFVQFLRPQNFLHEDKAIGWLFHHVLDPAICIYECPLKVFRECQNLPKHQLTTQIQQYQGKMKVPAIPAQTLYNWLNRSENSPPVVLDVREAPEYRHGHIPQAVCFPLTKLLKDEPVEMPATQPVVLVCRTGRRSQQAALALQRQGFTDIQMLDGGMLAWQNSKLIEAIDYSAP